MDVNFILILNPVQVAAFVLKIFFYIGYNKVILSCYCIKELEADIGYIRVSTDKQTCEHQKYEIKQFAKAQKVKITHWIEETISSGKSLDKRKLGKLLQSMKAGDILISCEISRLGRSMLEVMRILETCLNKECQVWTIKENFRLGADIQSKVMAFAFGISAEIERSLISQRTKSSLANIKASGKKLGRPFSATSKKLKLSKNSKRVKDLLDKGVSKAQIAKVMGVGRTTLRRFISSRMDLKCIHSL